MGPDDRAGGRAAGAPAFEAVYEAELAWVLRALQRLGIGGGDLDDAAHDVFIVVHRKLEEFDPDRPLRPWLFGIAFRVASDRRRRVNRRAEDAFDEHTFDYAAHRPESRLAAREALDVVQQLLQLLPFAPRAVLVMHELEGFTVPEIANAIGVPVNTAYSHLRRARNQVQTAARTLGLLEANEHECA